MLLPRTAIVLLVSQQLASLLPTPALFAGGPCALDQLRLDAPLVQPVGLVPWALAAADYNDDTIPDLAVAESDSRRVTILLGRGDGTFAVRQQVTTGPEPHDVAAADFNGDGAQDLAVPNRSSDWLSILLGRGDGTFLAERRIVTGDLSPKTVAVEDFNGDQALDIVVVNSQIVSVLLGEGAGEFSPAVLYNAGAPPVHACIADFNEDGWHDLIVSTRDPRLALFLGRGDGSFDDPVAVETNNAGGRVVVAPFNDDTHVDVATSGGEILPGNGDGTFQSPIPLPTDGTLWSADFDGDERLDLLTTRFSHNDSSLSNSPQ